jgi:UDP-N-acetylglucosamine--N-acetylmuramyl-(pentapeptide) pyrophosphoryl-undecaprenol N-acetylglucosamine transferase
MIVVSVGTNEARFDRILEWVAGLPFEEELVVQHGPSPVRPNGATCVAYLPFDELADLVGRCRIFVTHAGVGSIMVALAAGRRPLVVPRLKAFGEAVDDHQLPLALRLEGEGLVSVALSADDLGREIERREHSVTPRAGGTTLAHDLRSYLLGSMRSP